MDMSLVEYKERRIGIKRVYILSPGQLVISSKGGGMRFEYTVPLDTVRLPRAVATVREQNEQLLIALPFILLVVTTGGWGTWIYGVSPYLFWSILVVGIVGMIVSPFLAKRRLLFQYQTDAGVIAFDIRQSWNSESQFKGFTARIEDEVQKTRANQAAQSTARNLAHPGR